MLRTSFLALFAVAHVASAARGTTEASAATDTDPTTECAYYSFAPVNKISNTYPAIWATADLSGAGISDADKAVFASISSGIPQIAPRGTRAGDFSNVSYTSADPYCWWSWNKCTTPKLAGLAHDIKTCPEANTWGFTLDDGPNCSHNAYFDYLQTISQKATLFYIGSNVIDWPLEAQRGLADGHEICAHTWSHPYMTSMTNEQAFAELYFAKKIIKQILGVTVRCWRPPYGDVDDRIRWIATALDMVTIVWSEDTDDYNYELIGVAGVEQNYNNIISKGANGTYKNAGPIVLTHEIDGETMLLSQQFLPSMRKAFSGGVVPVGVCMNNVQPYAEQNNSYVYPNYAQYIAGTTSISLLAPTAVSKAVQLNLAGVATTSSTSASATVTPAPATTGTSSTSSNSASSSSESAPATVTKVGAAGRSASASSVALAVLGLGCLALLL